MNTTKKGIQLSDHKSNLIEIKNNKKPKVFFTLDPECPLCASYSKTISNLFQKHKGLFAYPKPINSLKVKRPTLPSLMPGRIS